MPNRVTFHALRLSLLALGLLAACTSREQQEWQSAQAVDTREAWEHFVELYPNSELAPQARAHIEQMEVQREWERVDKVGTLAAYRAFLAAHPKGKWAEQARIRIEGFSLGSAPRLAPQTPEEASASAAGSRVHALQLGAAVASASSTPGAAHPQPAAAAQDAAVAVPAVATSAPGARFAQAGEAAVSLPAEAIVRPKPKAAIADGPATGFGVQLGAFSSGAAADREWSQLQARYAEVLAGRASHVVEASGATGTVYRLQVAVENAAQARALCDALRVKSQDCVPVSPR